MSDGIIFISFCIKTICAFINIGTIQIFLYPLSVVALSGFFYFFRRSRIPGVAGERAASAVSSDVICCDECTELSRVGALRAELSRCFSDNTPSSIAVRRTWAFAFCGTCYPRKGTYRVAHSSKELL